MKKTLVVIIVLLLTSTIAYAAGVNGTFDGFDIIRVQYEGKTLPVDKVPAINYKGNTLVPIGMLREAGFDVDWDAPTQTVNIRQKSMSTIAKDEPEQKKLTIKDVYKFADAVGIVKSYDIYGNEVCSGSGFMVEPHYLITNEHVATCGGTGRIIVKIAGSTYSNDYAAWYMFANKERDLFASAISTSFDENGYATGLIPPTVFNIVVTDLPEVGDKVFTIGSPYGLENTVTEGYVSGIREFGGITQIQHTANTESGSSGGVLLDEYGYVIGVTSSGYEGTNLDFAIPIKYVKEELDKLR